MPVPPLIEIREPGRRIQRLRVDRVLEVGRDCDGIIVNDDGASRRHLKFIPSPLGLSVLDMGSRNGTLLNGLPLVGRMPLAFGDVLRIGSTELIMLAEQVTRTSPAPIGNSPIRFPAPPAAPMVVKPPNRGAELVRMLFKGARRADGEPLFRTYLELPSRVPLRVWQVIRMVSVLSYLALCVAMFVRPVGALFTLFQVIVPLLPILFFLAPGLWRNICPLAAANQIPRVFGFTRALAPPEWLRRRGYLIAMVLFFSIAGARLLLFNNNARATGILLAVTIANAFIAGSVYKGKSGWCSSICPLLPLQRAYGQTPFVVIPNSHCNPCVACTKNCYDFTPQEAYQADLHDPDPQWSGPRKLFVAALPGFVLGFFTLVNQSGMTGWQVYERLGLFLAVSVGVFFALEAVTPISRALLAALYAAAALNIFYWFAGVTLAGSVLTITGLSVPWLRWVVSLVVLLASLVWISRTYWAERAYLQESMPQPTPGRLRLSLTPVTRTAPAGSAGSAGSATTSRAAPDGLESVLGEPESGTAEVRFLPGDTTVTAETGTSVLELAEGCGLAIEAGCRMGVCGSDPIAVVAGMDSLAPIEEEEMTTLRRLGLASNTRMACCARLTGGPVQVNLKPEPGTGAKDDAPQMFDRSIGSVVIIGNGIAGVTAADFVRRGHPDCEIHLVGSESHVLYNRMGISRLVYGRSAMNGLFLLTENWYEEKNVTAWLNTLASRIDLRTRQVVLGTGDVLSYDRLILAMGGSGSDPGIENFGTPGSFLLRSADDAIAIRAYAQRQSSRHAVVAGGGLLGLEAAFALRELGLSVTVLERGARLMTKQIDDMASELVHQHFDRLGIRVLYQVQAASLQGSGRITQVTLRDGRVVPCQVLLACVGIQSNAELPARAGLTVERGVVVDDRMQTSDRRVFAAGDVAQHSGRVLGLWPIAAKQAEVAALNAIGGDQRLIAEIPATILKGVGLELSSIGRVEPEPGDEVIAVQAPEIYRRLVVSRGKIVGALVLGHAPADLAAATAAVRTGLSLDPASMLALRAGNWGVLKPVARQVSHHALG